jgi:hypothetical protein
MAKTKKTKTARESWFDQHVIVMGPSSDIEDKIRDALKAEVCGDPEKTNGENE